MSNNHIYFYNNNILSSYKHLNVSERKFSIDVDANDTIDQLVILYLLFKTLNRKQ